jgi:hypothetical protein
MYSRFFFNPNTSFLLRRCALSDAQISTYLEPVCPSLRGADREAHVIEELKFRLSLVSIVRPT